MRIMVLSLGQFLSALKKYIAPLLMPHERAKDSTERFRSCNFESSQVLIRFIRFQKSNQHPGA